MAQYSTKFPGQPFFSLIPPRAGRRSGHTGAQFFKVTREFPPTLSRCHVNESNAVSSCHILGAMGRPFWKQVSATSTDRFCYVPPYRPTSFVQGACTASSRLRYCYQAPILDKKTSFYTQVLFQNALRLAQWPVTPLFCRHLKKTSTQRPSGCLLCCWDGLLQ